VTTRGFTAKLLIAVSRIARGDRQELGVVVAPALASPRVYAIGTVIVDSAIVHFRVGQMLITKFASVIGMRFTEMRLRIDSGLKLRNPGSVDGSAWYELLLNVEVKVARAIGEEMRALWMLFRTIDTEIRESRNGAYVSTVAYRMASEANASENFFRNRYYKGRRIQLIMDGLGLGVLMLRLPLDWSIIHSLSDPEAMMIVAYFKMQINESRLLQMQRLCQ
jgi:hypothetical protein